MYPVFVRKGAMMKRSQRKQGRSKVTILSILPKRLFNGQWSTKKGDDAAQRGSGR